MKDINATYGFKNGDKIISQSYSLIKLLLKNEITNLLNTHLNKRISYEFKNCHVDVFSLVFYENLNQDLIYKIKSLLLNKLQTNQFYLLNYNLNINIDITIGCSKSANDKLTIYAEKALQNAKQNFENFMFFDSNLFKNDYLNVNLLETLKYNIENRKVEPYLHAITNNENNKVVKYEALMRIFDKDGNMLLPGSFLEKAKRYRVYNSLTIILIEKVFNTINKYKTNISINLEYKDILNPLIKNLIISKLQTSNVGKHLTIEILESDRISNFESVNDFIKKVKEYNVKIAIDDFGTGFSNYEYVLKLDIDYIKIDGSLIQKLNEEIYMNLVKSIVDFCKKQNIKLIAEYVSDLRILRYVKALNIDYSQGYYIQKPMSIEQIFEDKNEN